MSDIPWSCLRGSIGILAAKQLPMYWDLSIISVGTPKKY